MGRRKKETFDTRQKHRDRIRKARQNETLEQTQRRLMLGRERAAFRRKNETPEQTAQRRETGRLYSAHRIRNETMEEKAKRLETGRIYNSIRLQNEMPEEKARRQASQRIYSSERRQNETPEEKARRRESNRLRATIKRMNETPEAKLMRQRSQAQYMARKRLLQKRGLFGEWYHVAFKDQPLGDEWGIPICDEEDQQPSNKEETLKTLGLSRISSDDSNSTESNPDSADIPQSLPDLIPNQSAKTIPSELVSVKQEPPDPDPSRLERDTAMRKSEI